MQIEKRKSKEFVEGQKPKRVYSDFIFLCKSLSSLKLHGWDKKLTENKCSLEKKDPDFMISKIKLIIDECLDFSVIIFGWALPDDHPVYKKFKQSVRYDTVATLLKELAKLNLCQGLNTFHNGLKKHVVAKNIDPFEDGTVVAGQENGREFFRSKECELISTSEVCDSCISSQPHRSEMPLTVELTLCKISIIND